MIALKNPPIVAVPAAQVAETVADAGRAGVGNLVIFSSGFSETGEDGMRAQAVLDAVLESVHSGQWREPGWDA